MPGLRLSIIIAFACSLYMLGSCAATKKGTFQPFNVAFKDLYFPIDAFHTDRWDTKREIWVRKVDTSSNEWYSTHLQALYEPKIYTDTSAKEIYRFTYLRSFHNPIIVRMVHHAGAYVLYWKVCDGQGGYEPGNLVVDKQKVVDKVTWDTFQAKLKDINFWHAPTDTSASRFVDGKWEKVSGTDGAMWIVEGKTRDKYHVLHRWAPDEKDPYYHFCDYLLSLTDLQLSYDDKY